MTFELSTIIDQIYPSEKWTRGEFRFVKLCGCGDGQRYGERNNGGCYADFGNYVYANKGQWEDALKVVK